MRVVLQQRAPERPHLVPRGATRERVERLAPLEQEALARHVLLFDPYARGVHAAEDRPVTAAHHLADHQAAWLGHVRLVLLEARDARVDVGQQLVPCPHGFGQTRVRIDVIVTDHEEQRRAVRVRGGDVEHAPEPAAHPRAKRLRRLGGIADELQPAGVVVDEMRGEDAVARWSLPAELGADALAFVADAAREDVRAVAEAAKQLWRLRRMAEGIGHIADAHRASE